MTHFDTIFRSEQASVLLMWSLRASLRASMFVEDVHQTFAFGAFRFGDHYEWNKVTTCVHNILSGRRWIEHYGEITIRNTKSSACLCKLTFVKVTGERRLRGRSRSSATETLTGVFVGPFRGTTGAPTSTRSRVS